MTWCARRESASRSEARRIGCSVAGAAVAALEEAGEIEPAMLSSTWGEGERGVKER
jgi:hypothetical protein